MQMSASHEYENIITDCIYTRPALQPDCICVSLVGNCWSPESQKKPKNRDIFQSLVYMYARSTAHSLTSRCDAGKTCSLFIPYTGCCITELEIGFSEAAHLFYLLLVFSFLGFSFFLDGGQFYPTSKLVNGQQVSKIYIQYKNLQCRLFRCCRPRPSDSSPKINTRDPERHITFYTNSS